MSAPRIAALILLAASTALARPHRRAAPGEPFIPGRVVVAQDGHAWANCAFSTAELPERLRAGLLLRSQFEPGEPIWARCWLPKPLGPNRPGDLVDEIWVDHARAWQQAYALPVAPKAWSRAIAVSEILRTLLARLRPGSHQIRIVGTFRRSKAPEKLYEGSFRYVR